MLSDGDFLDSWMAEAAEYWSSHWTDSDLKNVTDYLASLPNERRRSTVTV